MDHAARLRPLERCVLRMSREGLLDAEIGRRLRRSPGHVQRVRELAQIPRTSSPPARGDDRLRPLERRMLRWLEAGSDYRDVGALFRRSPAFVEFVEQMAHYKLDR